MLKVDLISEQSSDLTGQLEIEWIPFLGAAEDVNQQEISLKSRAVTSISLPLNYSGPIGAFLLTFSSGSEKWTRWYYHAAPKKMLLPEPKLDYTVAKVGDHYEVKLEAGTFIKDLYLYLEDYNPLDGRLVWSDNFIQLRPGQSQTIQLEVPPGVDPARSLRLICTGRLGKVESIL